ncbi:hypothetical protein QAD02_003697 [Eretmocerus hayati]|uniref:Uncharacterized protein n=1 Tax=Eretmocerus hayati TaxID=131215 RepID=A0ACC2NNP1_9HYME|nr:hypothetical protein QAD02_003697 [Eretmocerus hayati]
MSMEEETSGAIENEFDRVEDEKTSFVPYDFKTKENSDAKMSFHVEHTLFDGKMVNEFVGNSSTLRCPICFKTNKSYQALASPCRAQEESFLKFDLTFSHAELKMHEQLLKLSYLMKIARSGKKSQKQNGNDSLELSSFLYTKEVAIQVPKTDGPRDISK